jgi:hypothetical protein
MIILRSTISWKVLIADPAAAQNHGWSARAARGILEETL